MKKTLFFLSFITPLYLFGQITILSTDLPVIGDTIPRQQDTLPSSNEGPSGVNQIWDFSNAAAHNLNNTAILNPNSTPYGTDFSGSNMAMSNDGASFIYFSTFTDSMITDGAAGDLLGTGEIIKAFFYPSLKTNEYPTAYGNIYQDTYGFDVKADGSNLSVLLDSIRLKHTGTIYDTIDGWGTTITPVGSYQSLRGKRVEYSIDSIWTKGVTVFPFPPPTWTFFDAIIDTTTTFSWLAKEGKLSIAELNFDSLDNPNTLTWTLMPAIPIASFSFTDNGTGGFNFSDLSQNTPTTWAWDFGDGNTSTQQNPSNQYVSDSSYYVCLTVTNSAGSDTFCDSVIVTGTSTNPPPIANFSYVDNGGGSIAFTDQSQNVPTSWLWNFGDGNTSTQTNPSYQYTTDSTYIVCLTVTNGNGTATYCDTLLITGTTIILAPLASFSWVDNGGGFASFTDLSANSPTSWAWDFGDGNTAILQNPNNTFTVQDTTFYVCLTATNSAGNNTYCDSVMIVDTLIALQVSEHTTSNLDFAFFPNPTSGITTIHLNGVTGKSEFDLQMLNVLGQEIIGKHTLKSKNSKIEIDLSDLKSGIYFYIIKEIISGRSGSGKLLVN